MGKPPYSILMFPQRRYPCDHAMLESVYTRVLPSRGYRVVWVMESGSANPYPRADWNGTTVHLLPGRVKPAGWRRLPYSLGRLWRTTRTALRIAKRGDIDVVQVRNEFLGVCTALILRARYEIPFVYQFSYPIVDPRLFDSATTSRRRLRIRLSISIKQIVLRRVLKTADLVLAISDRMRAELIAHGAPAEKIVSFPLGVSADPQLPISAGAEIRTQLGLGSAPTIIYFGAMDRLRQLDFLLDVMLRVLADVPGARLLMLGTAVQEEELTWLKKQSTQRGLQHAVHFLGGVPRVDVPRYLMAAHLSVAPIPPLPHYVVASPTKVIESLGAGLPVVANCEIPDQQKVITESGGGTCTPYEVGPFASSIVDYLRDPERASAAGMRGREYVLRTRSYCVLANEIEGHYTRLLQPAGYRRDHRTN